MGDENQRKRTNIHAPAQRTLHAGEVHCSGDVMQVTNKYKQARSRADKTWRNERWASEKTLKKYYKSIKDEAFYSHHFYEEIGTSCTTKYCDVRLATCSNFGTIKV